MSNKKCPPLAAGLLGFLLGVIAVKIVARFCPCCRTDGCCCEGECCGGDGEGECCGEHGKGGCCGHEEGAVEAADPEAGTAE